MGSDDRVSGDGCQACPVAVTLLIAVLLLVIDRAEAGAQINGAFSGFSMVADSQSV